MGKPKRGVGDAFSAWRGESGTAAMRAASVRVRTGSEMHFERLWCLQRCAFARHVWASEDTLDVCMRGGIYLLRI
jgi:hypothetical protein